MNLQIELQQKKLYRDPLIQSMCEEVKENLQQQQDLLPPTPPDFEVQQYKNL